MNLRKAPAVNARYLVISDLDGTLLDHYSYDWQAAEPAIQWLEEKRIPLVINTSKTRAEVLELQNTLKLHAPAIVENGSAIFIPKDLMHNKIDDTQWQLEDDCYLRILGKPRAQILSRLCHLRIKNNWKFEGFADWSTEKIAETTGLKVEEAKNASQREFSEALTWLGDDTSLQAFQQHIQQDGLQLLKGGRFHHVLGPSNKGLATLVLKDFYSQYWQTAVNTLVLGDGPNDCDMLEVADIAVAIKSPVHDYPKIHSDQSQRSIMYTQAFGPEGWNEAINQFKNSIM